MTDIDKSIAEYEGAHAVIKLKKDYRCFGLLCGDLVFIREGAAWESGTLVCVEEIPGQFTIEKAYKTPSGNVELMNMDGESCLMSPGQAAAIIKGPAVCFRRDLLPGGVDHENE